MREHFGPSIGIVFFSPCIGKKGEADLNADLLDVALTFEDLRRWFNDEQISFETETDECDAFVPYSAREGALYPIDGGMIAGVKAGCSVMEADCMSFSGFETFKRPFPASTKCASPIHFSRIAGGEGGCVNGPKAASAWRPPGSAAR